MAVAFEGFSIREYASKMRAVDVAKCWPFGGESTDHEISKEFVESYLPPITVDKFRWWSEELQGVPVPVPVPVPVSRSDEEPRPPLIYGESSKSRDEKWGYVEMEKVEVGLCEKLGFISKGIEVKMKVKSRAPKKRSILEIFRVAPQVESIDEEEEEEEEVEEEEGDDEDTSRDDDDVHNTKVLALCDLGKEFKCKEKVKKNKNNKKKMKKKKKKKKIIPKLKHETLGNLKQQKRMSNAKNKGPKKGRDCINRLVQSIAKKGKPHKLKLQSRMIFTSKPNSSLCSEGPAKDILDAVWTRKKKPRVKCLVTKKNELVQTSKSVKHQKPVFRVRGILKNHNKGILGVHSTLCNSRMVTHMNQCGVPQYDRHVRFSDMNDILGPRKPSLECPKLRNICSSNSNSIPASVNDHDTERGKILAIPELNGSDDDVSVSSENEAEVQPASTRQSSDTFGLDIPEFLRPHMVRHEHVSERSSTVNQVAPSDENVRTFKQCYRDPSHDTSYDCSPRFRSLLKGGYTQLGADVLRASNRSDRLIESQNRDPTCNAAAACSMDYVKAFSRPSSSYFAMDGNANERLPCPPHNTTVNYSSHALQYQPFYHLTPKELMRSICSFPDWNQGAVMGDQERADDSFCGLPLNSQGELIQLNSSGKGVFNQLMRPTVTVTGHSGLDLPNFNDRNCDGGAPTKDQLNVFPIWEGRKENPNLPLSFGIGISRIQGTGRTDVDCFDFVGENNHSVYHPESGLELMKISRHGQRQNDQIQNQIRDGKSFQQESPDHMGMHVTQPTMRLMGKEFTVGRSSHDLQAFEDGKVWTDKQIIAEHHPPNTAIGSSPLEREFQHNMIAASGKSKQNVGCLPETQIYQAPQNALQMKRPGSRFSHPYLHCKTDSGYPNCFPPILGNGFPKLNPYFPSPPSPQLFSHAPLIQDPHIFGYETLKPNSRMPTFASTPYGNMSSNSAEVQNKHKLPHAIRPDVEFPFLHPDYEEHVHPFQFHTSSTILPPWLLNATQQKETWLSSCQSYSDVGGRNQYASTVSGSTFRTVPSVQNAAEKFYPYTAAFSPSAVQSSLGPASFGPPPLMPLCREFIPVSSMNKIHGERVKFRERMSPRVGIKEPAGQGKKTRKRPAAKSSESPKPTKIPNLTVEEESIAETTLKASMAALELDSVKDKSSGVRCEINQEIPTTDKLEVSAACKIDGNERSGPVRLSAGAKHILKPSSDMNLDNSRPIHSTIPFAAAASYGRVSESEKKSARIYRF